MPNGTGAWALAWMAGLSLLAPAALAKDKPDRDAGYVYGPAPDWTAYKDLAETAVRARLIDPDSAKFEWPFGYLQRGYTGFLSRRVHGYAACGFVNSRNRLGGYVGRHAFAVVEDNGAVLAVDLGGLVEDTCLKASFPPADAMMGGRGGTTSTFAFTLTSVPDGAYIATVAPGSAAIGAGLRPGMVIAQLNGLAVKGMPIATVSQMLAGASGPVTLTMIGGGTVVVGKEQSVADATALPAAADDPDDPEATRLPPVSGGKAPR